MLAYPGFCRQLRMTEGSRCSSKMYAHMYEKVAIIIEAFKASSSECVVGVSILYSVRTAV